MGNQNITLTKEELLHKYNVKGSFYTIFPHEDAWENGYTEQNYSLL